MGCMKRMKRKGDLRLRVNFNICGATWATLCHMNIIVLILRVARPVSGHDVKTLLRMLYTPGCSRSSPHTISYIISTKNA